MRVMGNGIDKKPRVHTVGLDPRNFGRFADSVATLTPDAHVSVDEATNERLVSDLRLYIGERVDRVFEEVVGELGCAYGEKETIRRLRASIVDSVKSGGVNVSVADTEGLEIARSGKKNVIGCGKITGTAESDVDITAFQSEIHEANVLIFIDAMLRFRSDLLSHLNREINELKIKEGRHTREIAEMKAENAANQGIVIAALKPEAGDRARNLPRMIRSTETDLEHTSRKIRSREATHTELEKVSTEGWQVVPDMRAFADSGRGSKLLANYGLAGKVPVNPELNAQIERAIGQNIEIVGEKNAYDAEIAKTRKRTRSVVKSLVASALLGVAAHGVGLGWGHLRANEEKAYVVATAELLEKNGFTVRATAIRGAEGKVTHVKFTPMLSIPSAPRNDNEFVTQFYGIPVDTPKDERDDSITLTLEQARAFVRQDNSSLVIVYGGTVGTGPFKRRFSLPVGTFPLRLDYDDALRGDGVDLIPMVHPLISFDPHGDSRARPDGMVEKMLADSPVVVEIDVRKIDGEVSFIPSVQSVGGAVREPGLRCVRVFLVTNQPPQAQIIGADLGKGGRDCDIFFPKEPPRPLSASDVDALRKGTSIARAMVHVAGKRNPVSTERVSVRFTTAAEQALAGNDPFDPSNAMMIRKHMLESALGKNPFTVKILPGIGEDDGLFVSEFDSNMYPAIFSMPDLKRVAIVPVGGFVMQADVPLVEVDLKDGTRYSGAKTAPYTFGVEYYMRKFEMVAYFEVEGQTFSITVADNISMDTSAITDSLGKTPISRQILEERTVKYFEDNPIEVLVAETPDANGYYGFLIKRPANLPPHLKDVLIGVTAGKGKNMDIGSLNGDANRMAVPFDVLKELFGDRYVMPVATASVVESVDDASAEFPVTLSQMAVRFVMSDALKAKLSSGRTKEDAGR